MSFGTDAYFRLARQTSGNVAVTTATSFHVVPIISHNLATAVPELISDTIRQRYEEGPSAAGIVSAAGDVSFRFHPSALGPFLYAALGPSVSTVVGSSFRHVFTPVQPTSRYGPDYALNPFTIGAGIGTDSEEFQFTDGQCNRLSLEFVAGQYMRGTANFMCRISSLAAAVTVTQPSGVEFTWNQASVSLRGAASVDYENVTITVDNNLTFLATLDGQTVNRRILRNGYRTIRISGTADMPDNNEYDQFRAGSEMALAIETVGATINATCTESNERLRIRVPAFRYSSYPVGVSGPNRISVGFEGRAVFHVGSALAMDITLVNTRTAY